MRFEGKTVLITGAGSGIGAQTARRFAEEGANVCLADINFGSVEKIAGELPSALAIETDVSSKAQIASMVQQAKDKFGAIDILINNAMSCIETPFLDFTEEQLTTELMVNVGGPFFATQEVLPDMVARKSGVILNISSVNSLGFFGNEAYSAAKAAINSLTKSVAIQYGEYGIRCNAVAPGTIQTESWNHRIALDPEVLNKAGEKYPMRRVGQPDDVVSALFYLASDEASWVTGIVLPVEGGIMTGNSDLAKEIVVSQRVKSTPES